MSSSFLRIAIVGLGFIGGSLAAKARKAFPRARIVGISRSRSALSKAMKRGWIDKGFRDIEDAFKDVGAPLVGAQNRATGRAQGPPLRLVVICTPVDTLKDILKRLDDVVPPGTIVTDTGSVKGFLVRWADRVKFRRVSFVGAHPMTGSHERGIDAARTDLFDHSLTFVTPGRRSPRYALQLIRRFWEQISQRVVMISPEEHDRLTAGVSHLPHFLAAVLVAHVSPKAFRFATSGFRDTTRVAQGSPSIWVPIFLENRMEVTRSIRDFESYLRRAKKMLQGGDTEGVRQMLTRAQRRRASLK